MRLAPPAHFDLDATARTSRLGQLPPLRYDPSARTLAAVLTTPAAARAVTIHQASPEQHLLIEGLEPGDPEELHASLRGMLRIDEDLGLFYALTDDDDELHWARGAGAGRLLRSPSAYEDLVKVLLLARCSSARAQRTAALLCERLGPAAGGAPVAGLQRGFPGAAVMAAQPLAFYQEIGAGPVAGALLRLAQYCASGSFLPDSLRRSPLAHPSGDGEVPEVLAGLMEQEAEWEDRVINLLLDLPGYGERGVALLLPLLGCYDAVPLMDGVLSAWSQRAPERRAARPSASEERSRWRRRLERRILKRISPFGHYRALALHLLLPAAAGRSSAGRPRDGQKICAAPGPAV